jgi:hypothetical protein
MARRVPTLASTQALTKLDFVYVGDTSVGTKSDNKRIADVQLVHLFLRHFFNLNPSSFKRLPQPGRGKVQAIPLAGQVTGLTIAAISEFQRDVIRRGLSGVFVDGRVSVPTGLRVAGTKHVFTIIQLNLFFFNTNAENRSFNGNLEAHPVVKASLRELAAELATPKVLVDLLN